MTTLVCDFADVLGAAVDGTATISSPGARLGFGSGKVVLPKKSEQKFTGGSVTFRDVSPGSVVLSVDFAGQSVTFRTVVPNTASVKLSECLESSFAPPEVSGSALGKIAELQASLGALRSTVESASRSASEAVRGLAGKADLGHTHSLESLGVPKFRSSNTAGSAMLRDSAGRSKINDPVEDSDVANKSYVDSKVGSDVSSVSAQVQHLDSSKADVVHTHGWGSLQGVPKRPTDAPESGSVVSRDSQGRAKVLDPAEPLDIANKKYVDERVTTGGGGGGVSPEQVRAEVGKVFAGVKILSPEEANFTKALQDAVNDPAVKTVILPAGAFQLTDVINLDRLSGKRLLGYGLATVLKPAKNSGKNCFQSTSGGRLDGAEIRDLTVDMAWETGDKSANAFQFTNSKNVKLTNVTVRRSGGHGFLLQGHGEVGAGCSGFDISRCWVNGAGLKQNTVSQGASGFGVLIKDASSNNRVANTRIEGVSCGMGVGGSHTSLGNPMNNSVSDCWISMGENESIAFECVGFTRECFGTIVSNNQLPVSRDNGISIGSYSTVVGNVIGETWNHGIACSGVGTTIEANTISNIGLENSTRLAGSPKEWGVIALDNPQYCVVKNNTYYQTNDNASAHHVVKINISQGYARNKVGGNHISGNVAPAALIKGEPYKNLHFNPELPDVVDAVAVSVPAWKKYFDGSRRYYAPVSYWWADQQQSTSNWHHLLQNADAVPFVILNPRSGPGTQVEQDFVDLCKRLDWIGKPTVGYVRTTQDFEPKPRTTRPKETILAEVAKYVEYYQVQGVFLDEMVNGWSPEQEKLIPFYKDLFTEIKKLYGEGFLIVGNPGVVTKPELLECADVLMTFEGSAEKYLAAEDNNVFPHHYKAFPPQRFIHAVHNIQSREQALKVLGRMERSNVASVFLTTDTFSGVQGSEAEGNNPWDNLPEQWLIDMQLRWARRQVVDPGMRMFKLSVDSQIPQDAPDDVVFMKI